MTISLDSLQRLVSLHDTKAHIEALNGTPTEVVVALSTDTDEIGIYAGGTWHWVGAGTGPTFGTPAIVLGTAAAAGSTDEVIRRDSTIVAFDATAPADVAAVGVGSSTGSVAKSARRDHGHALTYHDEPLTDGASNFIFDGGDIVMVLGVPN